MVALINRPGGEVAPLDHNDGITSVTLVDRFDNTMVDNNITPEQVRQITRDTAQIAQQQIGNAPLVGLASPTPHWNEGELIKKVSRSKEKKKKVGVSVAIAHFTTKKAQELKMKLEGDKLNLQTKKKLMEDNQKKIKVLEHNVVNLEEKYNTLNQARRSELVSKYRRIITRLKKHPEIEKFATDIDKRILITTQPLFVQKKDWLKPREVGKYQIRIDFSKQGRYGIQILNLTRRCQSYDSPTINNTYPCWGNIGMDIENEFQSQDLYELVVDLIDYIRSPNDSGGYLGEEGDKNKGWEQFLKGAKPQPKKYSFYKHDQLEKAKNIPGVLVSGGGTYEVSNNIDTTLQQVNQYAAVDWVPRGVTTATEAMALQLNQQGMTAMGYRLLRSLQEAGFTDRAAYYFMGLVQEERIPPEEQPTQLEIRLRDGQIVLFINIDRLQPVAVSSGSEVISERQETRVLQYFVNEGDLRPELSNELRRRGGLRRRLTTPLAPAPALREGVTAI